MIIIIIAIIWRKLRCHRPSESSSLSSWWRVIDDLVYARSSARGCLLNSARQNRYDYLLLNYLKRVRVLNRSATCRKYTPSGTLVSSFGHTSNEHTLHSILHFFRWVVALYCHLSCFDVTCWIWLLWWWHHRAYTQIHCRGSFLATFSNLGVANVRGQKRFRA